MASTTINSAVRGPAVIAAAAPVRAPLLSSTAAFYLQVSIAVSFLAGSSAPTPLYALYQAQWGFSSIMLTVVFGIYALAVLAALLVAGSLSDYVGRRPVLIVASFVQAAVMLMFAAATSVDSLLAARVLQGFATGAAAAAVGAGMLDIDRARGTVANAVAPIMGTALGGVLGGLMAQYLPAPTHLVYLVLFIVFVAQGIAVMLMPESAAPRAGAWKSLVPHFRLPPAVRRALVPAIPVLVAAWRWPGSTPRWGRRCCACSRARTRCSSAGSRCSSWRAAADWPCCCCATCPARA